MGKPKLLLPWGDKLLIEHVLDAWKSSRVERLVVVGRTDDGELADVCRKAGVEVVFPDRPPPDMRASICAGIQHLDKTAHPAGADVLLVAPADLPELSATVINLLLENHDSQASRILVPAHDGKQGHPVLLPWALAADVQRLPETEGLRSLIARRPRKEIPCTRLGIPSDIDTPEDYLRLRKGDGPS